MAIKKGRELIFEFDTEKVGDVTSISLTVDGNIIDISNWDSGDWNRNLAGRKGWTMSLSCMHNPESDDGQEDLELAMFTSDRSGVGKFGPETPAAGDVTYSGNVIMSNFQVDANESDGVINSTFDLTGDGTLTRAIQPS